MFCTNCGAKIEDGATFCVFCGAKIEASQEADTTQGGGFQQGAAVGPEGNFSQGAAVGPEGNFSQGAVAVSGGNDQQAGNSSKTGKKKKGKGGVIALVVIMILLIVAGGGGALYYFTSDSFKSKNDMEEAEEGLEAEENDEAPGGYEEALDMESDLVESYIGSADILLQDGRYEEAIKLLEKGLKKTEDDEKAQERLTAKLEEVKQAKNDSTASKLQQYLDNELASQYGHADLSAKTQTFAMNNPALEENRNWTAVAGIADAEICDLDGDGRDELLVIALDGENISLTVYEVEDDAPVKKAELLEARASDISGYEVSCSMVEGQGIVYLLLEEGSWGIFADGRSDNVKLYRYDGTNLYTPLVVLQTEGGSSDFVYTAYQYDGTGNQLSEEVVYDEVYDHEPKYDRAHYYERVAALFGEYGLALDSAAAISGEKEIFDNLPTSAGYKELLYLDMWGDYRGDNVICHFNDWDSPMGAFKKFLEGDRTVYVGEGKWLSNQEQMDLTLRDMLKKVEDTYLESSDKDTVSGIKYAYLDCGDDGVEELALKFEGLDIYSADDDSYSIVVISCKDGALELVYACDSWARSYTDINYYGCIFSEGSGGAGDHLAEMGYINADGVVQTVYTVEILDGQWVSNISNEVYSEVFGDSSSSEPDMQVGIYEFNGATYYLSALGNHATQKCKDYIERLQAEGKNFTEEQEIDDLLRQYVAELGLKDEWLQRGDLDWRQWWY